MVQFSGYPPGIFQAFATRHMTHRNSELRFSHCTTVALTCTVGHGSHGTHGMHGRATVNSGGPKCFLCGILQPATYRTMSQPCQILPECIEFFLSLKYVQYNGFQCLGGHWWEPARDALDQVVVRYPIWKAVDSPIWTDKLCTTNIASISRCFALKLTVASQKVVPSTIYLIAMINSVYSTACSGSS